MPQASKKTASVLQTCFQAGTRREYKKGEIIISPDDAPTEVFFIYSGFVKSYDITKYGEENLLVIRGANQMFPVLWTMMHDRTNVYYQTMTETIIYTLPTSKYKELLEENALFAQAVLKQVLTMYRIHSRRVQNLVYRTAPERIAFRLLILADRFGKRTAKGIRIEAPMRRQDIAESINCSRETASREISKLEKKGIIQSLDGHIYVKNPEALMHIVGAEDNIRKRFARFEI